MQRDDELGDMTSEHDSNRGVHPGVTNLYQTLSPFISAPEKALLELLGDNHCWAVRVCDLGRLFAWECAFGACCV